MVLWAYQTWKTLNESKDHRCPANPARILTSNLLTEASEPPFNDTLFGQSLLPIDLGFISHRQAHRHTSSDTGAWLISTSCWSYADLVCPTFLTVLTAYCRIWSISNGLIMMNVGCTSSRVLLDCRRKGLRRPNFRSNCMNFRLNLLQLTSRSV